MGVCVEKCDPMGAADACGAGMSCYLAYDISYDDSGVTQLRGYCQPEGSIAPGAPCSIHADCTPGYGCTRGSSSVVCAAYCSLTQPNCGTDETCTPFERWQPVHDVGYCH
jgi:hypothetical protein